MLKLVKCSTTSFKGYIYEARSITPDFSISVAYAEPDPSDEVEVLTEKEYLRYFCNGGTISVDKYIIKLDGLDTAIVTAEVHPDLTEITFYHADTGEVITTVPVDPITHTATLQVTATTPGMIRIRAGEPTMTRLNECEVLAQ